MYHILIENSTPNHLVGGPWTAIGKSSKDGVFSSSDNPPSTVECGLKGGQIREALSHADIKHLRSAGKLREEQGCKSCLRKVGGRYGKVKNTEVA